MTDDNNAVFLGTFANGEGAYLTTSSRRRHLYVIGRSGSGTLRWSLHSAPAPALGLPDQNGQRTTIAALRGRMLTMTTPITSCLYYNAVSRDGEMPVQMAVDHRVFDGYTWAVILSELERILNDEIAAELTAMGDQRRAAAA